MTTNTSQKIDLAEVTAESLKSQVYADVFPEYYTLASVTECNIWHNNQNVLDHVIAVFAELEKLLSFNHVSSDQKILIERYLSQMIGTKNRKEILIVATLLHDIAKPDSLIKYPNGTAVCPGHELMGEARVIYFADRFGLDKKDEAYVKRIIRYHGFISDIKSIIIANGNRSRYLSLFKETVGDIALELILLVHADLLGCDLEQANKNEYDKRIRILTWMFDELVIEC